MIKFLILLKVCKTRTMFKLDHIGIAVSNLEDVSELFKDVLEVDFFESMNIPEQGSKVAFSTPDQAIELVQATQPKSPYFPILPHPIETPD